MICSNGWVSDAGTCLYQPLCKDLKLMIKRGSKPEAIKAVITNLIDEKPLDRKHRDHILVGNFRIDGNAISNRIVF